jgi:hypothetical protein
MWVTYNLISRRGDRFFSFPKCPDKLWCPPASYAIDAENLFALEAKWLWHEDDHSPPSSAAVKNEWSYSSAPVVYIHGVDCNDLTFCQSVYKRTHCIAGKLFRCIFNINATIFVLEVSWQNTCAICIKRKGNKVNGKKEGTVV